MSRNLVKNTDELILELIEQNNERDKKIKSLEEKLRQLTEKESELIESNSSKIHNKISANRTISLSKMQVPTSGNNSYNYPQLKSKGKELLEQASNLIIKYAKQTDPSKFG